MDAMSAISIALSVLGLVVGLIGGALGAFSIAVTWRLYRAGTQVNLQTVDLIAEIKASSHTTEVTSTRFTERLVEHLIETQRRDVQSSLVVGRTTLEERIDALLAQLLSQADVEFAKKVKERVKTELTNAFRKMEFQTASLTRLPEPQLAESSASAPRAVGAPGFPRLIKWIVKHEGRRPFLSVKFLREKVFAADPAVQEALQFAIDEGILETYDQPNPNNPSWPVTACRLKRDHTAVRAILAETSDA